MRATAKISIGTLLAIVAAALLATAPAVAATGGAGVPSSSSSTAKKAKKKKAAKKKAKAKAETKSEDTSDDAGSGSQSGGATAGESAPVVAAGQPTVAGTVAKIGKDGLASAPSLAPDAVKEAIWAANEIIGRPYVYGGGHASFKSKGYDCSGTVSYALHGGDLLDSPLDSGSFMTWGESGRGDWITIFTNPGHAYVVIAGIRLDTSAADDPAGGKGPRWRPLRKSNAGFVVRHPDGL